MYKLLYINKLKQILNSWEMLVSISIIFSPQVLILSFHLVPVTELCKLFPGLQDEFNGRDW